MRIQHNIMAMSAYRNYTNNVSAMKKNLEKLSSGYKINRAGDDAAGLAISEKMRAQITGLETAQKNAKDGISLVQTAEGALTEVHDMLNRMVELATQSANGTYDNTTDRNQMQKEINQLLSEINRIADSSNFNGINLLDGTLGLNTDAFKIEAGDDFVEAVAAETSNPVISDYHNGTAVTAQAPSFKIDLNTIKMVNGTAALAAGDAFGTITIGTKSYTLKATGAVAANATIDATDIGNALVKAFNTGSKGATASQVGVIAGAGFTAANAAGVVTFSYQGISADGVKVTASASDTSGTKMTQTVADAVNNFLGQKITVTAGTKIKTADIGNGVFICDIAAPKNAVVKKDAALPGVSIDLSKYVVDGGTFKIDGITGSKTYTFKTKKDDSVVASTTQNVIDVSKYAASDQAKMAAMIIAGGIATTNSKPNGNANGSEQTVGIFTISLGTGAKIHVDVASKADATNAANAKKLTEDKIAELFTVTTPAQAAKAATTKLTIKDASAITDGDTITVVDGTKTTKYVFGKGTDAADGSVKYVKDKSAKGLVKAIGTARASLSNGVITIKATTAAASVAAPTVLGRGLTLQIGDTADSFNQLNVAVQDMHADSIGVGGLDISTEVTAQQAVDKIKAAINTVSDVRGTLGATQNRLDHTINNLSVMTENIQDAESTIRDVDVAEEMMAYTKNNILIQSAQAMLAQANQVPQGVLQLLQ